MVDELQGLHHEGDEGGHPRPYGGQARYHHRRRAEVFGDGRLLRQRLHWQKKKVIGKNAGKTILFDTQI